VCVAPDETILGEVKTILSYRPGFKNQLMYNDVTATYRVYLSLPMLFFVRIKGCVNCCKPFSVHIKTCIHALNRLVTRRVFSK